jgi:hypothetical protein
MSHVFTVNRYSKNVPEICGNPVADGKLAIATRDAILTTSHFTTLQDRTRTEQPTKLLVVPTEAEHSLGLEVGVLLPVL